MFVNQISNAQKIKQLISTNPYVVVDFMAQWCGPCKMIGPKINRLAELHPSIKFIKVDVDETDSSFIESQDVSAMPTFRFFKDGKVVESLTVVGADFQSIQANVKSLCQ